MEELKKYLLKAKANRWCVDIQGLSDKFKVPFTETHKIATEILYSKK